MTSHPSQIILPSAFRSNYAETFGEDELAALEIALNQSLSGSLRINPLKLSAPNLRSIPWCPEGYYTDKEVTFGADPLWYAGAYYAQEPASMMVAQYFLQYNLKPQCALDLCAAPGGKSTLLRSYLPKECTLIANEPDSGRARILNENLTRWGCDETMVISGLPEFIEESGLKFDFILVDAPCSGEGMFRKEPQAITEWSEENVKLCSTRQRDILDEAWEMLQEEGVLIYSTCTYNESENEQMLDYLSQKGSIEILPLVLQPEWGVQSRHEGVYRFSPQHTESEGLTIFAIRKKDTTLSKKLNPKKRGIEKNIPSFLQEIFPDQLDHLYSHDERWYYLSPFGQQQLDHLKRVKILSGGVQLGEQKGKDFIPHTAWILSPHLSEKLPYPKHELNSEQALAYLKREAITMEGEKGIYIVTYLGVPLGAVKHLGNRTNNLYPKELVIQNKNLKATDIPSWEFRI